MILAAISHVNSGMVSDTDPEWKPNFTLGRDHLYVYRVVFANNSDDAFCVFLHNDQHVSGMYRIFPNQQNVIISLPKCPYPTMLPREGKKEKGNEASK